MTAQPDFQESGEDFIAHFGKLGMKWGVNRKVRRKYSDDKIKDSRSSIKFDQKHIKRLDRKGQNPVFGKKARLEAARLRTNLAGNDQVRIAKLKTKGEKAAILVLTLGVGSIYLARNQAVYNPKIRRGREEVNRILAEHKAEKIQRKLEKATEKEVIK